MTIFHPFPRLPLELREQIWKDTVEPRTVNCRRSHHRRITSAGIWSKILTLSSTPVPAVLQSCREARNLGLYERVFFEDAVITEYSDSITSDEQKEEANFPKTEQRYIWLNLDIDIVDIGVSGFMYYEHIASAIKRLKFERENSDEFFYFTEVLDILQFVNVEEIHIVCADGFWTWSRATWEHNWPCDDEKLIFIDPFDGLVARGPEFEAICRKWLMEARIAATGEAFSTDDEYPTDDDS